ncbi:hypothetical protein BJ138DRAFT_60868 [Hygrophoropsis aurantiaca]|uniref:Uncharacterized protein n=1 Tax=Hygrophoropsis aurantiaca TaxID=72124 RepID=A0ACB8ACB2_9AGAM|nr:hypothetical protein BJ138DRAFT_60868 [Hygrophoropsis aurantiaca]
MESPWDDDPEPFHAREADWTKISNEFTNSGYREGIIAGKESALQEGFDSGFANVGVPLGRELGLLRGAASAILSLLGSQQPADITTEMEEARDIAACLGNIRFSDIVPRDLEAEQHAREHLESDDPGLDESEELVERKKMEGLEDMLQKLSAGNIASSTQDRPTREDMHRLKQRLATLSEALGLQVMR